MTITVRSPAFENGGMIPTRYTCDGENMAPELEWTGAPEGTRSFAVVVEDPDAPSGTFRHWGIHDIGPRHDRLPEGTKDGAQTRNDFGNARYDGPMPPKGHGVHHYHFKVLALDVERLTLPDRPKVEDLWQAVEGHILDQGEVVGLYER